MVRPRIVRRFAAAFAAALLLFSTQADAYASAHCAHHGLAHDPARAQAPTHGHAAHNHNAPASAPQHDGACTCLGDCATSAPAVIAPNNATVQATPTVSDVVTSTASSTAAVRLVRFLIPFATAPPVIS